MFATETIDFDVTIEVVGMDQPIQPINDAIFANLQLGSPPDNPSRTATSESGRFTQALSKGYFWAFLFVFVGGILTSFTPCVYPLIPITVSVFGAGESVARLRSFLLSVTYVLGIALTYSILGIAVASTGAVFGQIMADPRVMLPVCGILLALGLSMLGVFELRVPYALQNRLNSVGGAGSPVRLRWVPLQASSLHLARVPRWAQCFPTWLPQRAFSSDSGCC